MKLSQSLEGLLSLGFALQDVSGGAPVMLGGYDLPLWGMEVDPDAARAEFRAANAQDEGAGVKNFLGGMGLGMLADQLKDLKLGELLDTPPPGLDEAVAIAKVGRKHYNGAGHAGGTVEDLKLAELLDTPPPRLDEAVAIAKVGFLAFSDQSEDLKLEELLDTPPPGLDEAVAIAKVDR